MALKIFVNIPESILVLKQTLALRLAQRIISRQTQLRAVVIFLLMSFFPLPQFKGYLQGCTQVVSEEKIF